MYTEDIKSCRKKITEVTFMLKKFTVSNYRRFQHALEVDFSRVRDYKYNENCIVDNIISKSIVYGKNAVGKSNLGYALMDIRSTLIVDSPRFGDQAGFINAFSESDEATFSYSFKFNQDEVTYSYSKKSSTELTHETLILNGVTLFDCDYKKNLLNIEKLVEYDGLDSLKFSSRQAGTPLLRFILFYGNLIELSALQSLYDFVNGMAMLRTVDKNYAFSGPLTLNTGIIKTILENDLVSELEKFLNSVGVQVKLKSDLMPDGEANLYFDYPKPLEFVKNASSGTRALTAIFTVFHQLDKISFLFIDEVDANLHFSLADQIINQFKQRRETQIMLTTHNTDLMSNKIMRPDCYFILTSASKCVTLADATKRELREGHNLEKLYQAGEFEEIGE